MDSVKVIDISSLSNKSKSKKKLTKKQLYKEILSSSDKVKEIISNRKKTQRFDYLNSESYPTLKPKYHKENEKGKIDKIEDNNASLEKEKKVKSPRKRRSKNKEKAEEKNNEKAKITNYFKKNMDKLPKQVTFNENANQNIVVNNIKSENSEKNNIISDKDVKKTNTNDTLNKPKLTQHSKINNEISKATIVDALQKGNNKPKITKRKSPKNQVQRSKIKKFNDKQIIDLLTILIKLNKLGETIKVHRTIRRINKYQVNQLLFALRLIKKWSNAPVNMLKNTLFTYITGDIKIV